MSAAAAGRASGRHPEEAAPALYHHPGGAMEQVVANLSGKVRRVLWDGRSWLVAPASMLVEGVLNGSQGPLFYPDEEIRKSPDDWNGMPITLGHPTDAAGRHVSARRRDVLERMQLGTVFEANHNGKLVSEAWFDEDRTRRLAPPVLASLTEGRPLELSTGLFTRNEPAPAGSTHNGKPYTHVARNYRPDHLAVLVGQKGACSIADGCGVLVNEAQAKGVLGRLFDWAARALGGADGVAMAVETAGGDPASNAQPRHPGTGNFLPAGADVVPTDDQRRLGHDALVQKQSGHNPPNWAVDEALWEKAKGQAAKAGHEEDWAYVVGIYQEMGGKIEGKPVGNGVTANDKDALGHGSYPRSGGGGGSAKDAHAASKEAEKLSEFHRGASADARGATFAAAGALKASASRAGGKHENAALYHEQAAATHRAEAAKAKPGFFRRGNAKAQAEHEKAAAAHEKAAGMHKDLAGGKSARNSEGATMTRDELLARVTANCGGCDDDDRAAFARLSDGALAALAGNAGMACPKGMAADKWAAMSDAEKKKYLEDQADAGKDDAAENPDGSKKKMSGNAQQTPAPAAPVTPAPVANAAPAKPAKRPMAELLNEASDEDRAVWNSMVTANRRVREQFVTRLTANAPTEQARAAAAKVYGEMSWPQLEALVAALPPPADPQQAAAPHYWGAAGAPAANAAKDDSDNLLPEVTLNFDELAAPALRRKQAQ